MLSTWNYAPGVKLVTAEYDQEHEVLALFVKGTTSLYTSYYSLERCPDQGDDLAFDMKCFIGEDMGAEREFNYSQSFSLNQPLSISLFNPLRIFTADSPQGYPLYTVTTRAQNLLGKTHRRRSYQLPPGWKAPRRISAEAKDFESYQISSGCKTPPKATIVEILPEVAH